MAPQRREREPRLDAQQRTLLVAFVVSLLAHHTFLSFVPAPRPGPPRPRPVQLELYEPTPTPARAAPAVPEPPPTLVALAPSPPPPVVPPDETPAQREERRRRELQELTVPRVSPRVLEPPPQPRPTPEPEPEEQQAAQPPAPTAVMPINMHFVHLPPPTNEPERTPDDVRFFAQRTQDVDVETRAVVTTLEGEESATAQARARSDQSPAPADGVADGQPQIDEREGSDEPDRRPARPPQPQPTRVASQGGARQGRPGEAQPVEPPPPLPQPEARPGGENGTVVQEPLVAAAGVRQPVEPDGMLAAEERREVRPGRPGEGPEVPGGPPVEPTPVPTVVAAGENGANGGGGSEGGPGADTAAPEGSLELDWATFQELFQEQLDRERQAFLERRQERRRMGGVMDRMDRVTAQLENFTPDVRPGNTTALDTLYHPFAEYLTAFHRQLHPAWGDGFLVSLIAFPDTHPLNDMSLMTKLEIVVNGDGTVFKVTIVRSSGNTIYDVAAINAVYEGEPYPEPPAELRSGDGRLYLRWAFYRNHSQCGVWNAEPYILPDPPSLHEEGEPPDSEHPTPPTAG